MKYKYIYIYLQNKVIITNNMIGSTKRMRFENVASKRVQKILDTLTLLRNCSNKNNYEYTEKDVELMFTEITKAVKSAQQAFYIELNKSNKSGFKF